LNEAEFPPLEVLERSSLRQDAVFLLFNSFTIYMYVGRQCDPFFYNQLFKVDDYFQIDKNISEDDIFANASESTYLTALSNIIE
jgi:hypothetical protein